MMNFDDTDLDGLHRRERLQGARFGLAVLVLSALIVICAVAIVLL